MLANEVKSVTKEQKLAAVKIMMATAETIREAGPAGVPSGPLYVGLMEIGFSMHDYNTLIDILKSSKLIEETDSHLLRWIGPVIAKGGR